MNMTKQMLFYTGVRAGVRGKGGGGAAAPPATEIMWFFGQNAHDSGNDTLEKKLQNNTVGLISKSRKKRFPSPFYVSLWH